jgi:hypothetical protein
MCGEGKFGATFSIFREKMSGVFPSILLQNKIFVQRDHFSCRCLDG